MKPIIIKQKLIPLGPYEAIALWPFIFTKVDLPPKAVNHERIHLRQQLELLVLPFYVLYLLNFLWNLIRMKNNPYRAIVFEREAYDNEHNPAYLSFRRGWAWTKYL